MIRGLLPSLGTTEQPNIARTGKETFLRHSVAAGILPIINHSPLRYMVKQTRKLSGDSVINKSDTRQGVIAHDIYPVHCEGVASVLKLCQIQRSGGRYEGLFGESAKNLLNFRLRRLGRPPEPALRRPPPVHLDVNPRSNWKQDFP